MTEGRLNTLGHFRSHLDALVTGGITVSGGYERMRQTMLSDDVMAPLMPDWLAQTRTSDEFLDLARTQPNPREFIRLSLEPAYSFLEEAEFPLGQKRTHPLFRPVLSIGSAKRDQEAIPRRSRVFIVHGHDRGRRNDVELFLRKAGLEPVVLADQPNGGRTLIEKFEDYSDVDFAVVLMTPDDEGAKKGDSPRPRARQNVVLELGAFIGRLGRRNVVALMVSGVEEPSDVKGILYIDFDEGGSWRNGLARELEAAGLPVDLTALTK